LKLSSLNNVEDNQDVLNQLDKYRFMPYHYILNDATPLLEEVTGKVTESREEIFLPGKLVLKGGGMDMQ
jgi:hypothetical protein